MFLANPLPTLNLCVRPWIPDQVGDDNALLSLVSLVLPFSIVPSKRVIRLPPAMQQKPM